MPKFCANLLRLFPDRPFMERFKAAKEVGFDAVEVLSPYDCPAQEMRDQLVWNGLTFVLMNCPPPNATGGAQGFAAIPGLSDRFRRDFDRTLRYAQILKPRHIHIMAGAAEGPEAEATLIEKLRWAAARAPKQSLTMDAVSRHEMRGCFLADYDTAARVIDTIAAPNLGLRFDAGRGHRITGDVMAIWSKHGRRATHIQITGFPDRQGPTARRIDTTAFFARLDADGYKGWVSAANAPSGHAGSDPRRMR